MLYNEDILLLPMPQITIDGNEYDVDLLSDSAKSQITNIQIVDRKLSDLQQDLIIMQTARNAYLAALTAEIKKLA